ncbi:hypothetical protein LOTGIDRAFT_141409 [Lottia gigantea]|uniref:F-box domain-containing protein n=1 Tax=Lottia gigantea TaxID=225164 RepID=V4B0V8_LOTGI|nr:hypothetical protein LOTGIDRAFT_141409 [Lottia gigantea]ESO99861.1 hypothetical protein LOTGIDRAFT_141409 [Lottia gigantea]
MASQIPGNHLGQAGSSTENSTNNEDSESKCWRPETLESKTKLVDNGSSETSGNKLVTDLASLNISQNTALHKIGEQPSENSLTHSIHKQTTDIYISDLPECVLLRIFHFVDIRTLILVIRKTCRFWHYLSYDRPKLEELDLTGADKLTYSGFETLKKDVHSLTHLSIAYTMIDDKGLKVIAENSPKLKLLNIKSCVNISDVGIGYVASHCKELESLLVNKTDPEEKGCSMSSFGLETLALGCCKLKTLCISYCHLIDDKCIIAVASNCLGLTELRLAGCVSITDASLMALGEHSRYLKDLESHNSIDVTKNTLIRLQNHSHLQSLHLSFCTRITNDTIIEIAKHCPDLQELSLRGCNLITDIAIASLVNSCAFLRILDLSGESCFFAMKISNVSLSAIANDCKYIERLMVSKNKLINLSGLEVLFSRCKSLESLELTVGEPMYTSFSGVMSLVNNIKNRIVKIANHTQIIANKQSGTLHIEFYPNAESNILNKTGGDDDLCMSSSSLTE